jgi:hypothetical protein
MFSQNDLGKMFKSMEIISLKNRVFNSKTSANLPGKEAMHKNAG